MLPLSVATGDYDRVRAIKGGRVRVEGCAVTYLTPALEELFIRALIGAHNVTVPWLAAELADIRAVLGDDYWPYGLAKNRASIEAALRYSHEQGLSARKLTVEEAFVPDLDWAVQV